MLRSVTARDYMAAYLVTFTVDTDVLEAVNSLLQYRISGAPVVDEQHHIIGILSEKDCLKAVLATVHDEDLSVNVGDLMTSDVKSVDADMSIIEVAEEFLKDSVRRYPVLEEGRLVGQISRRDILRAFIRLMNQRST